MKKVRYPRINTEKNPNADKVSFDVHAEEAAIIRDIVVRAVRMQPQYDPMDCSMDITACHANGCPLKLLDLLKADDFNFAHDVFGIAKHLDRFTGKLKNCFLPRFSQ